VAGAGSYEASLHIFTNSWAAIYFRRSRKKGPPICAAYFRLIVVTVFRDTAAALAILVIVRFGSFNMSWIPSISRAANFRFMPAKWSRDATYVISHNVTENIRLQLCIVFYCVHHTRFSLLFYSSTGRARGKENDASLVANFVVVPKRNKGNEELTRDANKRICVTNHYTATILCLSFIRQLESQLCNGRVGILPIITQCFSLATSLFRI
jgi:hypothetical protein